MEFSNLQCVIATCNLGQWAMDFDGNLKRTEESIIEAKKKGAKYILGPELQLSGYSCEDHFLEVDTYTHCDQSLASILTSDITNDILCDIGMPVMHKNVRYNCRIWCLNGKILLIRPKMHLADDGNYHERRFFTTWKNTDTLDEYALSDILRTATGQQSVPFGFAAIKTEEALLASEVCEELWTLNSPHINLILAGVDIIGNGSGSHHQLRKLNHRIDLIKHTTNLGGGVYVYANQQGCDGNRLYFDGSAMICCNSKLVAQASQFSLSDVEVITAVIDIREIRSYRNNAASFQDQSSNSKKIPIIDACYFSLRHKSDEHLQTSIAIEPKLHTPEEECAYGPACWLWDYMRRSGASGYLLPLSGGADSAASASIVRVMCGLAIDALVKGDQNVTEVVKRIMSVEEIHEIYPNLLDSNSNIVTIVEDAGSNISMKKKLADKLCSYILHTVYIATENSSLTTRSRAERLSAAIGGYHHSVNINSIIEALISVFSNIFGRKPQFECNGGSIIEDIALQNIQARLRMVLAYFCSQLFPWIRNRKGYLLVLGSANVDEALRGYMTKYDCSSADVNPIGGICKGDLKKMLEWIASSYDIPVITEIVNAPPSAELRPIGDDANDQGYTQTDEEDMGMTYKELGVFGYLRKIEKCGPVTMFLKLLQLWGKSLTPAKIAEKVKRFFYYYAINRHKMTTLTPSYHAESYSPDDNRFDFRQFLYNVKWPRQFKTIDDIVTNYSK